MGTPAAFAAVSASLRARLPAGLRTYCELCSGTARFSCKREASTRITNVRLRGLTTV